MNQIKPYGTAPIMERIIRKLERRNRQGFIPAGWGASRRWQKENAFMFN